MSIVIFRIHIDWRSSQIDAMAHSFRFPILPLEITATDSAIAAAQHNRRRQREKTSSGMLNLSISTPPPISQACAAARCLLTVSRPKPSSRPISMYVRPWAWSC